MACLRVQPEEFSISTLLYRFPVYQVIIPYSHIKSRPQKNIDFSSCIKLIFDCKAVTNYSNMLICQAGETLTYNPKTDTTRTFPSNSPAEDAILHVKRAVVIENFALIQAKSFV